MSRKLSWGEGDIEFITPEKKVTMDDMVTKIMRYESGEMDGDEMVAFFQELIDSGFAWELQGSYGRTAQHLIDTGLCTPKQEP
jgi:hypothetical protein